jgi:hypothetical protein
VAINSEIVAGFFISESVEQISTVRGSDNGTSLSVLKAYAADACVSGLFQVLGIGRKLKRTQIEQARALGYRMIVGRV